MTGWKTDVGWEKERGGEGRGVLLELEVPGGGRSNGGCRVQGVGFCTGCRVEGVESG